MSTADHFDSRASVDSRASQRDLPAAPNGSSPNPQAASPPPFSSFNSFASNSATVFSEPQSALPEEQEEPVPVGFDEAVLRHLCDIDCGLPLLLERLKQSTTSCREASNFFRKRAQIEEDYARANIKLARASLDNYRETDGRAGTFVTSYSALLRTHELLGDNHLRLSGQLIETADQLLELSKETERTRKTGKDVGARLEKALSEAESNMDKSRLRYESAAEELERCVLQKAGENVKDASSLVQSTSYNPSVAGAGSKRTFGKAMSKLKSTKGFGGSSRPEEELRVKVANTSEAYRKEVSACQAVRREHWVVGLPRVLRQLKEGTDEVDLGTQYHMRRYAYMVENTLVSDGITISPPVGAAFGPAEEGPGMKAVVEAIDNREDFKDFMQNYSVAWLQSPQAQARGPSIRGEGMLNDEGYVAVQSPKAESSPRLSTSSTMHQLSSQPSTYFPQQQVTSPESRSSVSLPVASTSKAIFGVDLGEQVARDDVDVPLVVEKCAAVIEEHGLDVTGIYRLSGTTSRVQRLKARLDQDAETTDLNSGEFLTDINDISSVLKLYFRELPIPLMTYDLYAGFLAAARIESDRLRHIRLHERVNDLPDANYATLKCLMGHLHKVQEKSSINSMTASNLAIVFGPTLFRAPPGADGTALQDMQWQCKAIETILLHYEAIFVSSEEEEQ